MRALMHIVLSSEDENIYQEVCHELKTFYLLKEIILV
jgi:hypothetical protein